MISIYNEACLGICTNIQRFGRKIILAKSCGFPVEKFPKKGGKRGIWRILFIHRNTYPQAVGLWIRLPPTLLLGVRKPKKVAKNMQRIHSWQAGILRFGSEYIGEWDFTHRGVDDSGWLPTICPKPQRQADQGIGPLFHSFHKAYCCCYLYYIYNNYRSFGCECIRL